MASSTLHVLQQEEEQYLCKTYGRYPIAVDRGRGSRLWDYDGKEYIDLLAGIAVISVGHANEEVAETIAQQARKLVHVSNLFYQKEQLVLAQQLLETAHLSKVFFCNSGAEANEAAFKIARRYQQRIRNKDAYEIITFAGAFHGRTLASVAATGQRKFQDGFDPMPDGFVQIPWGDMDALRHAVTDKTAAVMIETIQGEGGIRPVYKEFITQLAAFCKEHDILFMVDEVQAGLGRTGRWWAFQHFDVLPDVLTSAKGLANGFPIGAMMVTDDVAQAFVTGSHGTTFGGGALATATASKVMEIIKRDNLVEHAAQLGEWAISRFSAIKDKLPNTIREIRGLGLMIGIDLAFPGKEVWEDLLEAGFIVNLTQETILRLVPSLTVSKDELELFAQALEAILAKRSA